VTLIDTSSWIEYLRDSRTEPADRVEGLIAKGQSALCDPVVLELWNGVRGGSETKTRKLLEDELDNVEMTRSARQLPVAVRQKRYTVPSSDIAIDARGLDIEHSDRHVNLIFPLAPCP
jgi:predicted nucleic acid-binding protein